MSKLKEWTADEIEEYDDARLELAEDGKIDCTRVYIKSEADAEIRRLKRALYKACANWALSTLAWLDCIDQGEPRKWSEMRQKCLKKVEEHR